MKVCRLYAFSCASASWLLLCRIASARGLFCLPTASHVGLAFCGVLGLWLSGHAPILRAHAASGSGFCQGSCRFIRAHCLMASGWSKAHAHSYRKLTASGEWLVQGSGPTLHCMCCMLWAFGVHALACTSIALVSPCFLVMGLWTRHCVAVPCALR